MTLPASGQLSFSDIATELLVSTPYSLRSMSNLAGFSTPDAVSEFYNYTQIVTDGLVLFWDAANPSSYPGSGTTIYDLSGNLNHGTLFNGVGFSLTNNGVLTFDGTNDYVKCDTPDLTSTNYTVMGATRYVGTKFGGRMINGSLNNWLLGNYQNTTLAYFAGGFVYGPGIGAYDTNWRIYTGTGNIISDNYKFYSNNTLLANNVNGAYGPKGIIIGVYLPPSGGATQPSMGEFSHLLVYNRVLTDAEITKNYNATKRRFGF